MPSFLGQQNIMQDNSKKTARRMGENIFKWSNKEFISKIYKQLMQLNEKQNKTTQSENGQKT